MSSCPGLLAPTSDVPHNVDFEEALLEGPVAYPDDRLLSLWGDMSLCFFEEHTTQSQETISTTGYIIKRLLHKLCRSSFEIHCLRSAPELAELRVDELGFHYLVVRCWSIGEAAAEPTRQSRLEESCGSMPPLANDEPDRLEVHRGQIQPQAMLRSRGAVLCPLWKNPKPGPELDFTSYLEPVYL